MTYIEATTIRANDFKSPSGGNHGLKKRLASGTVSSAVANVDVDVSSYVGSYAVLHLEFRKITVVSEPVSIDMTMSFDGGSSFQTAYEVGGPSVDSNDVAVSQLSSNSATELSVIETIGNAATESGHISMDILGAASATYCYGGSIGYGINDAGILKFRDLAWACDGTAGTLDVLRFAASSGNIDGGNWILYGTSTG